MKEMSPVEQKFILHWGEMGTRWGLNRTVAQVHALLYLSPKPLPAEIIQEQLGVARSNVSTSLKELQGWGIIRLVHLPGDRRDHFESLKDVWEMFRLVLHERKRREVDPTLLLLRQCAAEAGQDPQLSEETATRLKNLLNFFETTTGWYEHLSRWPIESVTRLMSLGEKARKLLGLDTK